MKAMELLKAMNDIDDVWIESAEIKTRTAHKSLWVTLGTVAACVAVAVAFFFNKTLPGPVVHPISTTQDIQTELPKLHLSDLPLGMGERRLLAYHAEELIGNEQQAYNKAFEALPVFQNPVTYDGNGFVEQADTEAMMQLLLDAAQRLGVDPTTGLRGADEAVTMEHDAYILEDTQYRIEVNAFLCVNVTILASNTARTHLPPNADENAWRATAKQTIQNFDSFLQMDAPQIVLPADGYDVNGTQLRTHFSVYENAEDNEEAFLNAQLRSFDFYFDESGTLTTITWFGHSFAQTLGVYPMLSKTQATASFCAQHRFHASDIVAARLVYRAELWDTVFFPCYQFYVQTDDVNLPGMHTYTVYEMPAIDPAFLA